MAGLSDVDGVGEGGFGSSVAVQLSNGYVSICVRRANGTAYSDPVLLVPNAVCCDRWVMAVSFLDCPNFTYKIREHTSLAQTLFV